MSLDKHSLLIERTQRSANGFRFGLRAGRVSGRTPAERSVSRNGAQNFVSRSCRTKRIGSRAPSIGSTTRRVNLHHPIFGGMSGYSSQGDAARLQVQKEK